MSFDISVLRAYQHHQQTAFLRKAGSPTINKRQIFAEFELNMLRRDWANLRFIQLKKFNFASRPTQESASCRNYSCDELMMPDISHDDGARGERRQ